MHARASMTEIGKTKLIVGIVVNWDTLVGNVLKENHKLIEKTRKFLPKRGLW